VTAHERAAVGFSVHTGWAAAVVLAGVVGGAARMPSDLASILRSHTLVHAAEGDLFRNALVEASKEAGLKVIAVPSRVLLGEAAAALRFAETDLSRRVADGAERGRVC
jgi:hypothetical protein